MIGGIGASGGSWFARAFRGWETVLRQYTTVGRPHILYWFSTRVPYFVSQLQDVTERKKFEKVLKKSSAWLVQNGSDIITILGANVTSTRSLAVRGDDRLQA